MSPCGTSSPCSPSSSPRPSSPRRAQPARERAFTLRGSVTSVVDGDTLGVRLDNGRRERVRLIGVDTPERGACLSSRATAQARRLAGGRARRSCAATRPRTPATATAACSRTPGCGGRDLGFQQVAAGLARVYVYDRPFQRLSAYRRAEQAGRKRPQNVWRGCPTLVPKPSTPSTNCDASYPTVCIPPPPPDLDCAEVAHVAFAVRGPDPHGFDGDGDGVGCEG